MTPAHARLCALLPAALLAFAAPAVHAQDAVAQFYKGRQITVVIGSSPGGGYDTYGRLLGRHLGRHVPGNPNVVAANMPGAGSNVAAAHVLNSAPKDGTFIGAIFAGVIVEPLLGDRTKARLDPSKLVFVGNANNEVFVCAVRSAVPVRTLEDMRSRPVVSGASAAGGPTADFPTMLNTVLGTQMRVVRGYPGTREITLAVEKGEVDGACGFAWSTISVQYPKALETGEPFRILLQEDMTGHPTLNKAGVPFVGQLVKPGPDAQALTLFYAQNTFGRPFVIAPEVPADRIAALRAAFMAAMKDPELLADAKRLNVDIIPSSGEEVQANVARMFATPTEVVERVRKALGQTK
jgi:tripartite-type tricarboxylate transporter receptor subunit TctC